MVVKLGRKSINIYEIVYTTVIFLIVFNPPIIYHASFTILFLVIASASWCINYSTVKQIMQNVYIQKWLEVIICFFIFYTCMVPIYIVMDFSGLQNIILNYIRSVRSVVILVLVSFFLAFPYVKGKLSSVQIIKCMVKAGILQSIIAISSYLSPSIKVFFNTWILNNSRSANTKRLILNASFRNYGFAAQLYDNYGFAMALFAVLALAIAFKKRGSIIYYLYFAMIGFAGFINARSSLIITISGAFVVVFYIGRKISVKTMERMCLVAIAGFISLILLVAYISSHSTATNAHLLSGINEIMNIFNGEHSGYFSSLFDSFIFFPDDVSLLIGNGLLPQNVIGKSTDVGYIQLIWQNGIIGLCFAFAFLIYPSLKLNHFNNEFIRPIGVAIGLMITIYMIKLNCFGYGYASVVFTLFFVIGLCGFNQTNTCRKPISDGNEITLEEKVRNENSKNTNVQRFKQQ